MSAIWIYTEKGTIQRQFVRVKVKKNKNKKYKNTKSEVYLT